MTSIPSWVSKIRARDGGQLMRTRQGMLRRVIDVGMTILLLLQMAYQVSGGSTLAEDIASWLAVNGLTGQTGGA